MPRDIRYRKEFVAQNGIFWRLDIIPGDDALFDWNSNLSVKLGDETVLSISDIQINYRDELPFGFPEYSPLEIEFNLDTIPDDLKTYLTTGFKPGTELSDSIASNLCVLWESEDEGETYIPIWIGVQTPQLTSEITISSNNKAVSKITFQPLQTAVLSRCKWQFLNRYWDDTDLTLFPIFSDVILKEIWTHADYVDVRPPVLPPTPPYSGQDRPSHLISLSNFFDNPNASDNFWIFPHKLKTVFEVIRREIQAVFKYVTRQATAINRVSADKTNNYFAWEYDRYIGINGVMKVRKAQNIINQEFYDRLDEYLSFDDIYVPLIIDVNTLTKSTYNSQSDTGQTIGGIFNINDTGSFPAQYKTFNEFIIAISEFCCSKMIISYSFTDKLKMNFEVFGALERTNNTLPTNLNLFEESASESLTAEIGYICSSIEVGNSKAIVQAPTIPAQSPILTDLAKSQTFTIKNSVFSWDISFPQPVATNSFEPSVGKYSYIYEVDGDDTTPIVGFHFLDYLPIPCTTLFYIGFILTEDPGGGPLLTNKYIKVSEYVQIGDSTKPTTDNVIYYETDDYEANSMLGLFDYVSIPPFSWIYIIPRYINLYRWLAKWHIRTGTAKQIGKLFSKILTNPKNWFVRDAQIYNREQIDLGIPNKLIGHRIENAPPEQYQTFLGLPSEGVITSINLNVSSGLYTLTAFQSGFLKEI